MTHRRGLRSAASLTATGMAPPPSSSRPPVGLPRVAVIEAQPLFRDALCRVIRQRPQLQLAGAGGDAREGLELLRTARPDVALVDPALPSLSGDRLLTLTSSEGLTTRFLFVAARISRRTAYELVVLGASGCVLSNTTADELGRAIAEVAEGRTFLCPAVQDALVGEIRGREREPGSLLSPREHEVLRRVAAGQSTPAIAGDMYLSTSTVKTHLRHVYGKLEVSDRAAAVATAMRRGLIA
jgi:two-component system nitrate/nitrite response regulator NarL